MSELHSGKTAKVVAVFIVITAIIMLSLCGYNSYVYNKIGECFAAENYDMAMHYAESIPEGYKDVRKIENFIRFIKDFNENNAANYERSAETLSQFKGFENQEVNYRYNQLYISIIFAQKDADFKAEIEAEIAKIEEKSATEAETTTKSDEITTEKIENDTVYFLESSEVYHLYMDCTTLSKSKNILTGETPENRRVCKVCEGRNE